MKRYIKSDTFGISDEDDIVRAKFAKATDTSPRVLARLAEDPNEQIRGIVARNSSTPDEIRWKLAHDPDPMVRCDVLNYQYTLPEKYFELLVEDPDTDVRDTVACRLDAPVDVLRKLLDDENKHIRAMADETLNYVLRARGGN